MVSFFFFLYSLERFVRATSSLFHSWLKTDEKEIIWQVWWLWSRRDMSESRRYGWHLVANVTSRYHFAHGLFWRFVSLWADWVSEKERALNWNYVLISGFQRFQFYFSSVEILDRFEAFFGYKKKLRIRPWRCWWYSMLTHSLKLNYIPQREKSTRKS